MPRDKDRRWKERLFGRLASLPVDRELEEIAKLQGGTRPETPPGALPFSGDFRTELTRYLFKQRMGVRGVFRANPGAGFEERQFLPRVEVPDHMATSWVVTWSPPSRGTEEQVEGVFPDDILDTYAVIEFGVAGQKATLEVDWRQGGRVEVSGSSVSVEAVFPGVTIPSAPQGWPVTLSASIVPGTCPTPMMVTRTVRYGSIDAAASTVLPVPPFARRVYFQRDFGASTNPWVVTWARGDGTVLMQETDYPAIASRLYGDVMQPLIVPPRATFCRITNTSSGPQTQWLAIYELQV